MTRSGVTARQRGRRWPARSTERTARTRSRREPPCPRLCRVRICARIVPVHLTQSRGRRAPISRARLALLASRRASSGCPPRSSSSARASSERHSHSRCCAPRAASTRRPVFSRAPSSSPSRLETPLRQQNQRRSRRALQHPLGALEILAQLGRVRVGDARRDQHRLQLRFGRVQLAPQLRVRVARTRIGPRPGVLPCLASNRLVAKS